MMRLPRFEYYAESSRAIMRVFRELSPKIEPLSLDEAFLDISGMQRSVGPPELIRRMLKSMVHDATGGLIVSVGQAR